MALAPCWKTLPPILDDMTLDMIETYSAEEGSRMTGGLLVCEIAERLGGACARRKERKGIDTNLRGLLCSEARPSACCCVDVRDIILELKGDSSLKNLGGRGGRGERPTPSRVYVVLAGGGSTYFQYISKRKPLFLRTKS